MPRMPISGNPDIEGGTISKRKVRLKRDAISRARFFLKLARDYPYSDDLAGREAFEAYLEAAIVFGRVAIHRVHAAAKNKAQGDPDMTAGVQAWLDSLRGNPAIEFFRVERNFILKAGPPKLGQIVRLGGPAPLKAEELYYEDPAVPATVTAERYLDGVEKIVTDVENRFGTATLLGRW